MNKRQKEILTASLNEEKQLLDWLKKLYEQAAKDTAGKVNELSLRIDMNPENIQSLIYQKQYQEIIQQQIESTLNELQGASFIGINDYLNQCYETGFIGALYDIQGQGVPFLFPIDKKDVIRALQTDSKLSEGLYNRLGEDINYLKKAIKSELSRGIVEGKMWNDVAEKLTKHMVSPFDKAKNNAMRIARTEGHRVQMQGQMDSCRKAKKNGADVVKQWDATLDGRTRPTHAMVDGEIRELEEPFSNGLMMPSDPKGHAAEVINCRCALLQRAKWELDEDELQTLQERAEYFGLDKTDNFEDYREKYLNVVAENDNIKSTGILNQPVNSNDDNYNKLIGWLKQLKIDYNPVEKHSKSLTNEEIILALAGGDKTKGSCASLGLAYIGQRQGWNVLDFRDGDSRQFFATSYNLDILSRMNGIVALRYGDVVGKSSCTIANNFLKTCEEGKEYYLCVGRHASIVRKEQGVLQYLELQADPNGNWIKGGWTKFNGNPRYTLTQRFGCSSSSGHGEKYDFMINITDSNFDTDEFKSLLGYINTEENKQRKGANGTIK